MSKPKTFPCKPPELAFQDGWVRKCELDERLDRHLPIPTQVVSNEEFYPLPQTLRQLYRQSGQAAPSNTQYGWVSA